MTFESQLQERYADVRGRLMAGKSSRPVPPAPVVAFVLDTTYVPQPLRWRRIVDEVLTKHELTLDVLLSGKRLKPIVACRHECFYRLSAETTLSMIEIGRRLGGLDHTSVLHGIRAHSRKQLVSAGQVLS